jgi:hypothetical protein
MYDDIAVAAIFAIAAMMLKIFLAHRERMKGLSMTKQVISPSDDRLARVEQAVESIAIEVERIGEGQRFVTQLLASRPEAVAPLVPRVEAERR